MQTTFYLGLSGYGKEIGVEDAVIAKGDFS